MDFFEQILSCFLKRNRGLVWSFVRTQLKFNERKTQLEPEELVTKTKLLLFSVPEIYLISLETPYFTFVRDTLSYIVLLLLHYALCLSPTTVPFSGLEWVIFIFFTGRYLVERKQIDDVFQHLKPQRKGAAHTKCIYIRALSMYQR